MKKFRILITALAIGCGVAFAAALEKSGAVEGAMTKEADGTYVIDTSVIGQEIMGYNGPTPLKVYIKKDKIVKVEALPNRETPKYFNRLTREFLHLWEGQSVKNAKDLEPDGYSGATYSGQAVEENVQTALKYYQKHK